MNRDYIERRNKLNKFYKSKPWRTVREVALKRDNYLCRDCGRPAEHVHHIKHLNELNVDDPAISLNLDNLVCLCHQCHDKRHTGEHANGRRVQESNPYRFDENGMLVPK